MSDLATNDAPRAPSRSKPVHPRIVRWTHWINAIAIFIMVGSGWRIYNASPLFGFRFPSEITLGGWLGGALQWHFAAMWLFVINGLVYVIYGLVSGHFRRTFLPIRPADIIRDIGLALRFRLSHTGGSYNSVQRFAYVGVIAALVVVVLSGLAIWKPVQLQWLAAIMGGYEGARIVHFLAMSAIVLFVVIHLALVAIVPRTLLPMIWGRARADHDAGDKS